MQEIVSELTEVTEWHQLGVQLEVPPGTLHIIESNHPHDAKRCKTEVLNWWLENALEISWEKLAQAVEAVGGHAGVAKRLRLKMNPTPKGWEFCLAWGINVQICEPNCMRLHPSIKTSSAHSILVSYLNSISYENS